MTICFPGAKVSLSLTGKSSSGMSPSKMLMRAVDMRLTALVISIEMMPMVLAMGAPSLVIVNFRTPLAFSAGESAITSHQRRKTQYQARLEIAKIGQIVDARHFAVIGWIVVDAIAQQRQGVAHCHFDQVAQIGRALIGTQATFFIAHPAGEAERYLGAQRFAAWLEHGVIDRDRFDPTEENERAPQQPHVVRFMLFTVVVIDDRKQGVDLVGHTGHANEFDHAGAVQYQVVHAQRFRANGAELGSRTGLPQGLFLVVIDAELALVAGRVDQDFKFRLAAVNADGAVAADVAGSDAELFLESGAEAHLALPRPAQQIEHHGAAFGQDVVASVFVELGSCAGATDQRLTAGCACSFTAAIAASPLYHIGLDVQLPDFDGHDAYINLFE